ncbi:MAG: threonine synthase [Alphaproteobacteria bacterium]|nr:threonine synthase [Alphaproteobacteria bacterium]
MRYVSTRGTAPALEFEDVLLAGLARDGGLYVPETWPALDAAAIRAFAGLPYAELARRIMAPFVGRLADDPAFAALLADTYAKFGHPAVAPLAQLAPNDWLLDLTQGPTLAFKDYALQFLGRLFDLVLARRGARITIVGATSGDTGSAAIEACRDRGAVDVFILFPNGRVSEVQRRQMTTVPSANIHCLAIDGTFDDCQALVKAMFNDAPFRDALGLSAVNSINWARIMAQTVYYVAAAVALGAPDRRVAFSVPTGNFGNVFAGYVAARMGLPVERFIVATNRNDILARFYASGTMATAAVEPSLSPSMDIQVSSNFERLLFDLYERDARVVTQKMAGFAAGGVLTAERERLAAARPLFVAGRRDDEETTAAIAAVWRETGMLIDPHTAIGVAVGRAERPDPSVPLVALATAHPAKFPDAVVRATGIRPELPPRLGDLFERPERVTVVANDLRAVEHLIRDRARIRIGARAGRKE